MFLVDVRYGEWIMLSQSRVECSQCRSKDGYLSSAPPLSARLSSTGSTAAASSGVRASLCCSILSDGSECVCFGCVLRDSRRGCRTRRSALRIRKDNELTDWTAADRWSHRCRLHARSLTWSVRCGAAPWLGPDVWVSGWSCSSSVWLMKEQNNFHQSGF